jgi:integrase
MMTFTELASVPRDPLVPFTDQLQLAVAAYLAGSRAPPAITPNPICAASWSGAPSEHGHRVLRVCGKGNKIVLVPLPPAVGRAIDQAIGSRTSGPILLNTRGSRMDRHAATRRLRRLAETAGVQTVKGVHSRGLNSAC